jgi:hypothetical protein
MSKISIATIVVVVVVRRLTSSHSFPLLNATTVVFASA